MRTLICILVLCIPVVLLAEEVPYYVDNVDGENNDDEGQGSGPGEDAWKTIIYAFDQIGDHIDEGIIDSEDEVTVNLDNGPFHLGEDNTSLKPISWWNSADENEKPYLIIDGGAGRTTITGIDPDKALPEGGWTQLGDGSYRSNWIRDDVNYDFDWVEYQGENHDVDWYANLTGDDLTGTEKWFRNIANVSSTDPDDNIVPQYGAYFFRKEMIVLEHSGGFIRYQEAPLEYITTEIPDEFDKTFYVNWMFPLGARVVQIRSTSYDPTVGGNATVYIPVFEKLATFGRCKGVELLNLEFCFANSYWDDPAVKLSKVKKIVIDNCIFRDNNGKGLKISGSPASYVYSASPEYDEVGEIGRSWELQQDLPYTQIIIQNTEFLDNGIFGCTISSCSGLIFYNCTFDGNNWLGYHSGTMGWATGANKFFTTHRVMLNHITSENNYGAGTWFDQDARSIYIWNSDFSNNYYRGLFLEISPGPFDIDSCTLENNSRNLPADVEIIELDDPGDQVNRVGLNINSVGVATFRHCVFDQSAATALSLIRIARAYGRSTDHTLEGPNYPINTLYATFNDCEFIRADVEEEPLWINALNDYHFCYYMYRTNLGWASNGNSWFTGANPEANPPSDLMNNVDCPPSPYVPLIPIDPQR